MTVSQSCYVTPESGGFPPRERVPEGSDVFSRHFSIAWAVASGGTLAARASMISIIILIKYVITSLAGQKALISATLSYDATLGNASPITSTSVTCRAKFATNHNRRCA